MRNFTRDILVANHDNLPQHPQDRNAQHGRNKWSKDNDSKTESLLHGGFAGRKSHLITSTHCRIATGQSGRNQKAQLKNDRSMSSPGKDRPKLQARLRTTKCPEVCDSFVTSRINKRSQTRETKSSKMSALGPQDGYC